MPTPSLAGGRVLVTGGAGFIGTTLARELADRAEEWVVLDSLHPQVHPGSLAPTDLPGSVDLRVGDVTSADDLDAVVADLRPDTVVHLAAETGTAQSLDESTRHGMVNVVGTTQLLDSFTRAGHVPSHFVLTSSRAVYGEGVWRNADGSTFQPGLRTHAQLEAGSWDHGDGAAHVPNTVDGTHPNPINVYGATKLAQEQILSAWTGSRDTRLSILRLQNVYGPRQSLSNPYTGIVSLFSRMAREGQSIPLYEDGDITRDFVYIDDVVDALVAAIARKPADHVRIVDVGSGVRTTIGDLAREIAAYHSAPAPHVTGQYRDGDVRHASCDVEATLRQLDWRPRVSLRDGIAELQRWIATQLE
ncbi:epimerase/dehydratase [Nocardioides flavus (ex Wang et al. 2016)]|uniref:Epimerase/dehydratase n=1 Tax=Nocardioides flavus (ex Wang et al. 2016) TaxID=2058780 RepID=A0ABQ3HDP0_9ACTN|nr:NAD-dependent epimerase/dehydratase family protein [Nocardioides flavus (ex Wang et al. 2016)]GHE15351.1 epimerase/dehydratase [Nocardioides flavus (ex Wang et al. 2016)]